jgi:hypothetical protein
VKAGELKFGDTFNYGGLEYEIKSHPLNVKGVVSFIARKSDGWWAECSIREEKWLETNSEQSVDKPTLF